MPRFCGACGTLSIILSNDLDQRVLASSPAFPSHRKSLILPRAPRSINTTLAFDARLCYVKTHTVFTNFASKSRALRRSRTAFSKPNLDAFWYLRQNLVAHMSLRVMHCNVESALWQVALLWLLSRLCALSAFRHS